MRLAKTFTRSLQSICLLLLFSLAMAQLEEPQLPQQWFDERSPLSDHQRISICLDSRLPEHDLHERLAEVLASALLADLHVVEVGRERHVEAEDEELYVDLIDRDAMYLA